MKIVSIILVLLCWQIHAIEYAPILDSDISAPALNITNDDQGNWLEITSKEWRDVVFTDKGEQAYIYQHGYNYQKQEGFLRTFTLDRKLVSETHSPSGGGMVSREELLLAFELFKNHKEILKTLEKETIPIYIFGGFGFADKKPDQACYHGQRCVHVFAHTDEKEMIAHAIVKLNDRSIPYPDFDGINKKQSLSNRAKK